MGAQEYFFTWNIFHSFPFVIFYYLLDPQFSSNDSTSCCSGKNDSDRPNEVKSCKNSKNCHPKPHKNVNFFVYYVDWKYAL